MNESRDRSQDTLFYLIKTVAGHSVVYGASEFAARASSLILVPLYVRLWPSATYGSFELFVITETLLLALVVLGFNSALVRYYPNAGDDRAAVAYFRTAWTTVLGSGAVVSALVLALAPGLSRLFFGTPELAGAWRLVAAWLLVDALGTMFLALFRSQSRPFPYLWINVTRLTVILVLNLYLVGVRRMGLSGALIGNLVGTLAGALTGLMLARRECRLAVHPDRLRQLAGFGLPLVAGALGMFAMNSSDRYFMKAWRGLAELGVYSFGYRIGMVMSVLVYAFNVAWPPIMFRIANEREAPAIFARVLTYYLVITSAVLCVITSYAPEVVHWLGKGQYAGSEQVVLLILLSYVALGVYNIVVSGVTVTDRTWTVPLVVGAAGAINIAANLLLIPRYGMWGAAWATFASFAALVLLMAFTARRFYPLTPEWGRLFRLAVLVAAMLVVNLRFIDSRLPAAPLLKLGPLLVGPAALVAVGFFSAEERLRMRLFLTRRRARPEREGSGDGR